MNNATSTITPGYTVLDGFRIVDGWVRDFSIAQTCEMTGATEEEVNAVYIAEDAAYEAYNNYYNGRPEGDRDVGHEADMRALRKEQLAADCDPVGDAPADEEEYFPATPGSFAERCMQAAAVPFSVTLHRLFQAGILGA